jgi:3-dehydroquinate dehydratase/shikimate dehydrogenase
MSGNTSRVCAVITEETIDGARTAIKQAAKVADLVEIRLDYLTDFDFKDLSVVRSLVSESSLPTIVTCRAASEGGRQQIDDETRLTLLAQASWFADYCDIEAVHYIRALKFEPNTPRLIVSHHDFTGTPADLDAIYERVTYLPSQTHKIAATANNISDSLAVLKLLDRARRERHSLIALAMGEPGLITRVMGPAFGSFLTYGALGTGKESAPGQPSCEELVDSYRVHKITRATAVTGIIGNPTGHSASPAMHNRAFARLDLDFVYLPFKVEDLDEFFRVFVRPDTRELDINLRGFSITVPHKREAIRFLDHIDDTALSVGAVNTVAIRDGRLIGYNTDAQGAIEPLERITQLNDESCAVLGAGGAARAVIHGLIARGASVNVFARNLERVSELAARFDVPVSPIEKLASCDAQIVINATPIGMRGYSEGDSPVPKEWLRGRRIAYDLVYNPRVTRFLCDAKEQGCITIGGLEMLVAQAALQFELWTGQKPPLDAMREAAIAKIAELDETRGKLTYPL